MPQTENRSTWSHYIEALPRQQQRRNLSSESEIWHHVLLLSTDYFSILLGGKTLSDHTICYVRKQGVVSGWEQEFPKISLPIPPKTFPTLISCKCIAVLYFIVVSWTLLKQWSGKKRFGFRIDSNYYSMLIESSGIQLVFIPMNSGTYLK